MEQAEARGRMYADLLTSELRVISERNAITQRALLYIEAGLPAEKVWEALKISRPTWYRRVRELRDWQAANTASWA